MPDPHRFTTDPGTLDGEGELQWGGETDWTGDIDQREGIAVENGAVVPDTAPPIPSEGLLIHWKFDESAGAETAQDSSGNDNDGSISGAIPGEPGRNGGTAYGFTGDSDYVSAGTSLLSGVQELSVATWTNPASLSYTDDGHFSNHAQLVGKQGSDGDDNFLLGVLQTGDVGFYLDNGNNGNITGGSISTGTWNLVTGVYDGNAGEIRLYVNDSVVASGSIGTGPTVTNPNPLGVGAAPNKNFSGQWFAFDGRLQDVFMYDSALTDSEVNDLYAATR